MQQREKLQYSLPYAKSKFLKRIKLLFLSYYSKLSLDGKRSLQQWLYRKQQDKGYKAIFALKILN
jgi:hypothetical protein